MEKNIIIVAVVFLITGIVAGYGFLGNTVMPFNSRTSSQGPIGQVVDQHFIEQMIPHHEGAIAMAELALVKSKRSEILFLANGIIEAQKKEITDMRNWYKNWFGSEVPEDSLGMGMMGQGAMHMDTFEGDLENLSNAQEFDLEFVRQMIPHHEMAVMMARMLAVGTDREEMKVLAQNIITSQSDEIGMMRSWYKTWAGKN